MHCLLQVSKMADWRLPGSLPSRQHQMPTAWHSSMASCHCRKRGPFTELSCDRLRSMLDSISLLYPQHATRPKATPQGAQNQSLLPPRRNTQPSKHRHQRKMNPPVRPRCLSPLHNPINCHHRHSKQAHRSQGLVIAEVCRRKQTRSNEELAYREQAQLIQDQTPILGF